MKQVFGILLYYIGVCLMMYVIIAIPIELIIPRIFLLFLGFLLTIAGVIIA